MSKVVQEKFQVNYPRRSAMDHEWATDKSARDKKGLTNSLRSRYNLLPPGANIEDQRQADIKPQSWAGGLTSGTQVTEDVTASSLKCGFDRKKLLSTDDSYTREHNDAFYDEVEVDGVEGFVERNNMLDRM